MLSPQREGVVVDLQGVRQGRRLELYRRRLAERLEANRVALESLYPGGALLTERGTRAGRALLRARQHLLRAEALLEVQAGRGVVPAPRLPEQVEALYGQVDALLARAEGAAGQASPASVAQLPSR